MDVLLKDCRNLEIEYKRNISLNADQMTTPKTYEDTTVSSVCDKVYIHEHSIDKTIPKIKRVHHSNPCTIVIFEDGDKVISRCHGEDKYDPEYGLMMCIMKKLYGGVSNVYKMFDYWKEKNND